MRKRDNHTCQHPGCTITNDEHKEEYGRSLNVHHIIKARLFDSDDERGSKMDNLVTLCERHHAQWERISPLTPEGWDSD